ncbi:helix-turn-helix domain-containing protein [Chitinophaga filiformis]|uniref:AraC-type DNA-binding protein n=1 Tax=Chitinophaga filiformis TaxID=104663 RepID=A0A1G7HXS5_CHIFI|nr:helix-turn-helix domain-containing protein [Chitinophaga filiformis]SDF04924.1 AraC-type DNA-binding protein [Chitinophaga filiformis]
MVHLETYIPTGALAKFVNAIIYLEDYGSGLALQRVYQNIIINLGDNFWTSDPYTYQKGTENKSPVWINGKHETPLMIENYGKVKFFVIAVKPGLLPYFISTAVSATNEKALSYQYWSSDNIISLRKRLLSHDNIQSCFAEIEDYFEAIISKHQHTIPSHITYLPTALKDYNVDEICKQLGFTRKKLWKEVNLYFGSSVKTMQGIIRFDKHLAEMANDNGKSLSAIHDFYDQPHFNNDFKRRTGLTPRQYKMLCQRYPDARHTPNFIPLTKETFLQFLALNKT